MTTRVYPHYRDSGVERPGDVPDARVDESKANVGYETPLSRQLYVYEPSRGLDEIKSELHELEREIAGLLAEFTA